MRREIHLFGGQGSNGIYDDVSLAVVRQDAQSCQAAKDLLARCHSSLIQDCALLFPGDEVALQIFRYFPTTSSLLSPHSSIQRRPAVQAALLCLYQLLRFLGNAVQESSYEQVHERIQETLGFSSGVLPAVTVAASPNIVSFVENGAQAFRAAFSIGRQSGLFSHKLHREEESWVYAINGLSYGAISQMISDFNETSRIPITIASILRHSHITVSGPKFILDEFIRQLPGHIQSRPVQVHSLYHGGEQMQPVVDRILDNLQKLSITLPSVSDLSLIVRDAHNGSAISPDSVQVFTEYHTLSRWIVEGLIVRFINWPLALDSTSKNMNQRLSTEHDSIKAVAYGPFATLTMADLSDSPKLSFEKVNVSHENPEVQLLANYESRAGDIAIVGVGLDFPNGSNMDEFWQTLLDGKSFCREVPLDRFSRHQTSVLSKDVPHHGNFVANFWEFDHALFGISPREAKAMDPQQRLLLQCSYHALEHAGYVPDSTKTSQRETMACFIGVATGDYADRASEDLDVYHSTGTLRAFLSGRLSYYFRLSGPSVVVDTACSGSLVAIHQACRSLLAGECDSALAGGVNVICGPEMHAGLARSHFLSPTGQCLPFDANADGYCRAEGCGIFVLKRLPDALAENDRVLGVIKGTGINQSGNAHSITHPHEISQTKLMKQVLQQSGVLPQTVGVVEAHGTGTQAGDPVEFASITASLATTGPRSSPLVVSSVKGNIGHAEAASGSAGLIKLLLMVAKGMIPPQAGFESLNPKIAPLMHSGVSIPIHATVWQRVAALPRRALLNNFGASGSNACLIVEEHIPPPPVANSPIRDSYIFALSAKDRAAFDIRREGMIRHLRQNKSPIQHLSYTSLRHVLLETCLVVVVNSSKQLLRILEDPDVEPIEKVPNGGSTKIVLVFSGQGSNYTGMGRELFETTDSFRQDVLQCDEIFQDMGHSSILPIITSSEGSEKQQTISQVHCAALALQYALTRLWVSWGVPVDAIIGHSLGEYAAFVAAQVLTLKDAIWLLANRARLIEDNCSPGSSTMIAVKMGSDKLHHMLSSVSILGLNTVSVACDNSPDDCVLSVSTLEVEQLQRFLGDHNIKSKKLDVPFGFHSTFMEPLRQQFNQVASKTHLREPSVPLSLALRGKLCTPGDINHAYFSSQTISSVRFREAIQSYAASLEDESNIVFLEIGPHPSLLPMIKASMSPFAHPTTYLGSLHRAKENWRSLADSVAELARQGVQINWRQGFSYQNPKLIDFPLYPFAKTEHQIPARSSPIQDSSLTSGGASISPSRDSFVSARPYQASDLVAIYDVDPGVSSLVDGHRVAGFQLCPASVYVELAMQAATRGNVSTDALCVRDITFPAPLVGQENAPLQAIEIKIDASPIKGVEASFSVSPKSGPPSDALPTTFCCGTISAQSSGQLATPKRMEPGGHLGPASVIQRKMLYETIFTRVVSYSPLYQTIDWLQINRGGKEAQGSFRLREDAVLKNCKSQPVFIDTLLHAAGFLANCSVPSTEVCICTGIKYVNVLVPKSDWSEPFELYAQISSNKTGFSGTSHAFDSEGILVAVVEGIEFKRLSLVAFQKSVQRTSSKGANFSAIAVNVRQRVERKKLQKASDSPRSKTLRILQQVTGVSGIKKLETSTFSELGIDSLMMIELSDKFRIEFSDISQISESDLSVCTTLSSLQDLINRSYDTMTANASRSTVGIQDGSSDDEDVSPSSLSLSHEESTLTTISYPSKCASPKLQPLALEMNTADSIRHVIARVTGVPENRVALSSRFDHLGLDSLMVIELCEKLSVERICDPDLLDLDSCQTVQDIVALVEAQHTNMEPLPPRPAAHTPRLLKTGPTTATPLYLIHDGSGTSNMYNRLGQMGRSVYGISADNTRSFRTLSEMADAYATMISPTEPIMLGGWSFGGVVAFEMARTILKRRPSTVVGLLLIDSPCPTYHEGLPTQVLDMICRGRPEWVLGNFNTHSALLSGHQPSMDKLDIPVVYLRSRDVIDTQSLCGVSCAFLDDPTAWTEEVQNWEELVRRPIQTIDIPGNHFQCFEHDMINETSEMVSQAILLLENGTV
ncbi:putative Carrier domain-containing protein [Seiridium cardinale]|uniref:Carrier domain-containing protein n=1 Tax=Seiridium cardinale TaxID=138064 RepID=A0ABR2XGE2_9PEZI